MPNITKYAISHRAVISFMLGVMLLGGIYAFYALGKREDSTFVIKSAVLTIPFEGATPEEVEAAVVEPVEREMRTLSSIHKITSEAHFGYARILVELHPSTPSHRIPQLWDELRRKVDNLRGQLAEGVGEITVTDDFGELYGLYFAIVADEGYSWDELREYAKGVMMRLYGVEGVERVVLYGEQSPVINLYVTPSLLASFDLTPTAIAAALADQSVVGALGSRRAGDVRIELTEGSAYGSLADIENQLLTAADGKQYRLGDVARIERGYREPAAVRLRVDGRDAIGIAVASDPERDIVAVGELVDMVVAQSRAELPVGVDILSLYPENIIAREANYSFLLNLVESLAIVILLVMVIMGLRAGFVVGSSLLFAIGGTLLLMLLLGEGLNRTSLAGFIIAMGMLVDNAIVVTDNARGLLLRRQSPAEAVVAAATAPRAALLIATLIAIISFLPLQLAPSSVAEIIRPLFVVITLSLLLSWVLSMTQVPLMGLRLFSSPRGGGSGEHLPWFRGVVRWVLRHRISALSVVILLFALSLFAMARMPQNFFPQLSKPYFRADVLLPEGYDIEATQERLDAIAEWLSRQPEVKRVSTTAGATPPRYYLASGSYSNRPNYGNVLVELHSKRHTAMVEERMDRWVEEEFPDVWLRSSLFKLSPVPDATIEFGFVGESADTLRRLTAEAMAIMQRNSSTRNVRNSWGNRVAVWQPRYSPLKAQRLGVERGALLTSLDIATSGSVVAMLRDGDMNVPILLRTEPMADGSLASLQTMPIFSRSGRSYALEQAAAGFDFSFATSTIEREDGERVMKAQCDPRRGVNTLSLLAELRREIEAEVVIPEGYRMELFGEEESREESNGALVAKLPVTLLVIFLLLLLLFGNYRNPIIVLLTTPLIFIGVVAGLLVTGKMFDFFSLLGLLGLVGMNVKSAVILISRIEELRGEGIAGYDAVVRAAADRFIPVVTAAGTTVLGMLPLLFDSMFGSMAATIMGGLIVATLLVLILLPLLYSLFYRIRP